MKKLLLIGALFSTTTAFCQKYVKADTVIVRDIKQQTLGTDWYVYINVYNNQSKTMKYVLQLDYLNKNDEQFAIENIAQNDFRFFGNDGKQRRWWLNSNLSTPSAVRVITRWFTEQ